MLLFVLRMGYIVFFEWAEIENVIAKVPHIQPTWADQRSLSGNQHGIHSCNLLLEDKVRPMECGVGRKGTSGGNYYKELWDPKKQKRAKREEGRD